MAVVRLDDGKVNVISHRLIELLHEALDAPSRRRPAVAILGSRGQALGRVRPDRDDRWALERRRAGRRGRPAPHAHLRAPPARGPRGDRPRPGRGRTPHALVRHAGSAVMAPRRSASTRPPSAWGSPTSPSSSPRPASPRRTCCAPPSRPRSTTHRARSRRATSTASCPRRTSKPPSSRGRPARPAPGRRVPPHQAALHQPLIDRVLARLDDDMQTMTGPA